MTSGDRVDSCPTAGPTGVVDGHHVHNEGSTPELSQRPPDPPTPAVAAQAADEIEALAHAAVSGAPKLFISYRRNDTRAFVEALDSRLRADLGSRNVFRDVHDLIAGESFDQRIVTEIDTSDVVLVVIGPAWPGSFDHSSPSRLAEPNDFVRKEVAAALRARPRTVPIPVLVDGATFPSALPSELEAIKEHHYVELNHDQLTREDSAGYQKLLVAAWIAKSRTVPNAMIIFGDDSPTARARLDDLVDTMKERNLVDVSRISRYACGAEVLSLRKARHMARRYPDVIVVVDEDSAQSPVLAARVAALEHHRLRNTAILTISGGITFSAGLTTGTGALKGVSSELGSALARLRHARTSTKASRLMSWQTTIPTATKLAAGAAALGIFAGGGLMIQQLIAADPAFALAGDWDVGTFAVVQQGTDGSFQAFEAQTMSFRKIDPDCDGSACAVTVSQGPEFLRGATIEPVGGDSFSTMLASDQETTIRLITGGINCPGDGEPFTDITDEADLAFDARPTDGSATADLEFAIIVNIPETSTPTGQCTAGQIEWTATAVKLNAD